MEDYIYILIGVIWIAASIFKATKKNRKPASSQEDGRQQKREPQGMPKARSLLEELFGGQEVKVPEPEEYNLTFEEEVPVKMDKKKTAGSFHQEYANFGFKGIESLKGEGESSFNRITFVDEMKQSSLKRPGQNKVNLRKAIIYSTILERPYT